LGLTSTIGLLQRWATGALLQWINRISGVVIMGFGLVALIRAAV
jgi:hypothetical protein